MGFLQGLSEMGKGVAQFAGAAGLELQRSQLAQEQAILADQLATTRETLLQGKQQAFTSGENVLNRAADKARLDVTEAGQDRRTAAQIASDDRRNAATIAGALQRTQLEINKEPEVFKILRGAGFNPDGTPINKESTAPAQAAPSTPVPSGQGLVIDPKTGNMSTPNAGGLGTGSAPSAPAAAKGSTSGGLDEIQNQVLRHALNLPALGSPADVRAAIAKDVNTEMPDATPGQRGAEIEKRYDTAKTLGGLGGREGVQFGRVAPAATMAAEATKNIMELPSAASTGWFGGRVQGHSLMAAVKESLTNTVTSQEVQSYNVMLSGVARNLSTIETSGLAPNAGFTKSMESVILKEGDTELTKMRKMAEIRQIVEFGLEPALVNPRLPDVQKDQLR